MRRPIRWQGVVVSMALVVFITLGTTPAQGAYYKAGYYNIYYNNSTELSWAKSLAAYLNEAWRAAYTVIGKNSLNGQINLYFYNQKDGRTGYTSTGQNGYLNRYYFSSYQNWGAGVAYNTTKLLFYNYTGAASWNSGLNSYATFLWGALSNTRAM